MSVTRCRHENIQGQELPTAPPTKANTNLWCRKPTTHTVAILSIKVKFPLAQLQSTYDAKEEKKNYLLLLNSSNWRRFHSHFTIRNEGFAPPNIHRSKYHCFPETVHYPQFVFSFLWVIKKEDTNRCSAGSVFTSSGHRTLIPKTSFRAWSLIMV